MYEGLTEVVRGSLTGSVVGNLLLVLGFSLVAGPPDELDRKSSFLSFGAIAVAMLLFLIPSVPSWDGDPDRHLIVQLSVPVSIALLVVYVVVTLYSLRRHREMHVASDEEVEAWTFRKALVVLGAATVVTALVAEILVGSLEVFAEKVGLRTSSSRPSSSQSSATPPSTAVPSSSPGEGRSSSPRRSRWPPRPRSRSS